MICQKDKLYYRPLANQKVRKVYTTSNINYSKKIRNKDVFDKKVQV